MRLAVIFLSSKVSVTSFLKNFLEEAVKMFRLNLLLIFGLSTVFALELKHLCEERSWLNVPANSFYQLKLEKDLEPLSYYIRDEDPSKAAHEEILGQLYLNRLNLTEIIQKLRNLDAKSETEPSVRRRRSPRGRLGGKVSASGLAHHRANSTTDPQTPIQWFRVNLERLKYNRISKDWLARDVLRLKLKSLNEDLDEKQISVFQNQTLPFFYDQQIAMLNGFTAKRNQRIYLDDNSIGTVHFSLYLPFNDQYWMINERNCYNSSSLPPFYRAQ